MRMESLRPFRRVARAVAAAGLLFGGMAAPARGEHPMRDRPPSPTSDAIDRCLDSLPDDDEGRSWPILSPLAPVDRADWTGTARPDGAPFRLPAIDALRRDPRRIPRYAEAFRSAVERLGPAVGPEGDASLLFLATAVQPRLGGFALFPPGLPESDDLAGVLALLGSPVDRRPATGGGVGGDDEPFPCRCAFSRCDCSAALSKPATPSERKRALHAAAAIPPPLRGPLARLLLALVDAEARVRLAWRRLPAEVAFRAATRRNVSEEILDGGASLVDVGDAARGVDAGLLAQAGSEVLEAVARGVREIGAIVREAPAGSFDPLQWSFESPRGLVIVDGTGSGGHRVEPGGAAPLLLLDLGGDDLHDGGFAAATWPARPVAVAIDLGGRDRWVAPNSPAQGSGSGGVGVLWDESGDDLYVAGERSQGWAQFGAGILVDGGGDDLYRLGTAGQGAALFGGALLLDRDGCDRYQLQHDGQGWGGPGGTALLADLAGDDVYDVEPDAARAGRPDPRTGSAASPEGSVATSDAQGVGVGRRADASDGDSWSGGLGVLVDLEGNDVYRCGTWCQGVGYWYGGGFLIDGAGDDRREGAWYSLGAAAHHGVGGLVDEAGDDAAKLFDRAGASLGFATDFATALFLDRKGNDHYRAGRLALGAAIGSSFALFVDEEGGDRYEMEEPGSGLGHADGAPTRERRSALAPAAGESTEFALFLDLAGADSYPIGRGAADSAWGTGVRPARRSVSGGCDDPAGVVDWGR